MSAHVLLKDSEQRCLIMLGEKIKEIRYNKKIKVEQLADMILMSEGHMRKIESGEVSPRVTVLARISTKLGFDFIAYYTTIEMFT